MSRLLQQHQTQQQLHCQGDTEYLPAITEALLLLREKELCFEERCVKLGLSALLTPPPPPPLFLPSEKDKDKEKDKSKEKEKDSHSSAVERRETVLSTSSLSPTSVPFVPSSSFSPPAALRPPTDILEGGRDQPLFTSPPPSATPTTPLPSTVPSSPSSSLSPSLPRSGVTATGTGTGTGTAGASGAVTATGGSSYHMFQAPQGDLIFLHPLCTKCLLASVQNDPALLPHTVSGAVLETEKIRVNASLKQKIPFLRYLPEYCEVIFVELSMKDLVPTDILILFQEEFNKRAKKRREREKILKKEKKIENDVM